MRNYGNGVENRCGGSSKRPSGGDFTVPELFLELSGLEKSRGLKLTLGPGLILITGMEPDDAEKERIVRGLRDAAAELGLPLEGMEKGLFLPAEMLEEAGFSPSVGLDELACTIEEGRILIEAPEEDENLWDTFRDHLPEGLCALLEDLGADPEEVWDILKEEWK